MSHESDPLLRSRSLDPSPLSSSLPLGSPFAHHVSYGGTGIAYASLSYGSGNSHSLSQSPQQQRRPLDRIHHLPPPSLISTTSIGTYQNAHAVHQPLPKRSGSISLPITSPSSPSRLSSLLSSALKSPAPKAATPVLVPAESKRIEVIADRTGRPQVREEREWPNPKKDAQYDDDTLLDYHSILIVFLLITGSLILYTAFPDRILFGNPAYVWTIFAVALLVVYHLSQLIEASVLSVLSLASGSRVWKVYFYSQALHETLGNVLTILFVMWARYECPWVIFPTAVKHYLDPLLNFALLLFIAVLIRQLITKHLTYVVNQERYSKAVQDLLFKGHALARLCDPFAYQPLYERPAHIAAVPSTTPVNFPYTPVPSKRRDPVAISAAARRKPHPLYDIFARLRDFNENFADDSLPGAGNGGSHAFFASEKLAKSKCKELFRNVDRDRKGYLDIHDFRAFFPKETALRAFKLFFPPKAFKSHQAKGKVEKILPTDLPPMPFAANLISNRIGESELNSDAKAAKKKAKKLSASKAEQVATEKANVLKKMKKDETKTATIAETPAPAPSDAADTREVDATHSRKGSATILESMAEVTKEPAIAADNESKESAVPALAAVAVANSTAQASPAVAEAEQTVGEAYLEAQSESEKILNSLQLDYAALETRILGFFEARQTLSRQLRDLDGLADVMQSISQLIFWMVIGILLIIVFDEHLQSVMFSLSTLLLSFTFVFATTIKDMFQSIILIFATKPYSVGDRVNIGKDKYRVHSIQLLTTTFRDLQNKISIVPNSKLAAAAIQNLTRSSNVVVKMKVSVAFDTPSQKLATLRERIVEHVRARPLQWKGAVSMHLVDLQPQTNTVNVSLLLSHLASYTQVKEWKRSKTELLHAIREVMIELGIAWKNPEATVSIVNSESIKQVMEGVGEFVEKMQSKKTVAAQAQETVTDMANESSIA